MSSTKDADRSVQEILGQQSPKNEANMEQNKQTQVAKKPAVMLIRYLEESKKEGHFTNLRVDEHDGVKETAFIGS